MFTFHLKVSDSYMFINIESDIEQITYFLEIMD